MTNIDSILESPFWKRGRRFLRHYPELNEWKLTGDGEWLRAAVNFSDGNFLDHIYDKKIFSAVQLRFDLFHLLSTSYLDPTIRRNIIDQCKEVKNNMFSIDVLPFEINFILMPPNVTIPNHKHMEATTYTITYIYSFNYLNPVNVVTINDVSHIVPVSNKLLLTLEDNPTHAYANNAGWSFIWVCDYDEKVVIPNKILEDFTVIIKK